MEELGRVRINLDDSSSPLKGYLSVNSQLRPLPTGSFLDAERGIFYWQPGAGFTGHYRFEFITIGNNGFRKRIDVNIVPRFNK